MQCSVRRPPHTGDAHKSAHRPRSNQLHAVPLAIIELRPIGPGGERLPGEHMGRHAVAWRGPIVPSLGASAVLVRWLFTAPDQRDSAAVVDHGEVWGVDFRQNPCAAVPVAGCRSVCTGLLCGFAEGAPEPTSRCRNPIYCRGELPTFVRRRCYLGPRCDSSRRLAACRARLDV